MSGRIGLVLSGGGAKGAYEVGVYKALSEMGVLPYIDTIAGTSVGALNATLLESRGAEYAQEVWNNLKITDLLNPDRHRISKALLSYSNNSSNLPSLTYSNPIDRAVSHGVNFFRNITRSDGLFEFIREGLPFNQEKIAELIDNHVDFGRIRRKLYVMCTDCIAKPKPFLLNQHFPPTQKKIILASSTLPVVYTGTDGIEINGINYFDGGVAGDVSNTPVSCLYDSGCRNIIVVHLKRTYDMSNQEYMNDANIINIFPSRSLGTFLTGTLNLNPLKVQSDMELGYRDTADYRDSIARMIYNL
ncbi:MAG: patatin-like phospholipase family protein [Ruminococcus sp.]|nr:patatin-like phospholipase family protein [Ruminococcus sp.]